MAIHTETGPSHLMPSGYFLDKFVAHKMSELTECGAPELSMESSWLNDFILSSFSRNHPPDRRAHPFEFIRRTEGAFSTYREARAALIEYIEAASSSVISPYFRALLYFELCLSQCWQGCDLIKGVIKITEGKEKAKEILFKEGDNTDMERLYEIYTDSRHYLAGGTAWSAASGQPWTHPTTTWITNRGIESARCPSGLSFPELVEILLSMGHLAGKLSRFEPAD